MSAVPGATGAGAAPGPAAGISARLIAPLEVVAGRANVLSFVRALLQWVVLAGTTWLVVVVALGSRVQVGWWAALGLAAAAWAATVIGAVWLFKPVLRRRDLASAARLVDQALPDTQERISSAIELTLEEDPTFRGSPEMVACLVRQAEHHADSMNPTAIVSGRQVKQWFGGAALLAVVWFIVLVVLTPNVLLGWQRALAPWSAEAALPAPVLAVSRSIDRQDPQPGGDATLTQGQAVEIDLEVRPPEGATLFKGNQPAERATLEQHFSDGGSQSVSLPMERTSDADPQSFRMVFNNVQKGFTYELAVKGAQGLGDTRSPTYTVAVQTLPAVAGMALTYMYPKYTRLASRTDTSREGAIDALVGTKVGVTVETTQPLKTAQLLIDDVGGGPGTVTLTPVSGGVDGKGAGRPQYAGELTVVKSTQYRIALVNAAGLKNADAQQARPITARPDLPPQITILSPTEAALDVRPDDTVPLKYQATDDFAVSRVEAVLKVDEQAETTAAIPAETGAAQVNGEWPLSLTEALRTARLPGTEPKVVVVRLRATDNREPNPQAGDSKTLTLRLKKDATPLAQRMDTAAAKDLASAIQRAQEKLDEAQKKLEEYQKNDTQKTPDAAQQERAAEARQAITEARQGLTKAAEQAEASRLGETARQARAVADDPVRKAEEETVKGQLATDDAAQRSQNMAGAQRDVREAQARLAQLAGTLNDAAKDRPLAQSLEKLADAQQKLAEAMAKNPNDPALKEQQRQLQQQLEQLIKEHPELQKTAAEASQSKVNDLVDKIQQLEKASQPLGEQMRNAARGGPTPDGLKEMARQQEELNQQIGQFNQAQQPALQAAGARGPDPARQEAIVNELANDRLPAASRDQASAASQLENAADKLDTVQKRLDAAGAARQKAADQAAQQAKETEQLQAEAEKLAQQIKDAKAAGNTPSRPSDPANQEALRIADEIKKEAQQMTQTPAERAAAQAAARAADAAKAQASQGKAEAAQQQLAQAASQLSQAARDTQSALGGQQAQPNGQTPGQAAEQARQLADKQRQQSDATAQAARAQEEAASARTNGAATAQRQQQLGERIDQASKDAQALRQQTSGAAPQVSERVQKAEQALQQAAEAQQSAAQATRGGNTQGSAAQQDRSADSLAKAEEALTGQPSAYRQAQNTGAPRTADAQNPQRGAEQATPSATQPNPGRSGGDTARGNDTPPPGASRGGSLAQGRGRSGDSGPGQPGESTQGQSGAGQSGTPGAASPGQGGQPGQAAGATAGAGQGNGPNPGMAGSATGGAGSSEGGRGIGQAVQAARSAQSQAVDGNPAAAQRAADALSQASREMMPANGGAQGAAGGTPGAGTQGMAGGSRAGGTPGAMPGAGGGMPGSAPGGVAGAPGQGAPDGTGGMSGGGVRLTQGEETAAMPKAVEEVGLSPSEWAKLPPRTQEELLHAAQQPGPPEYRDMIKNYYSRIARMQAEGAR